MHIGSFLLSAHKKDRHGDRSDPAKIHSQRDDQFAGCIQYRSDSPCQTDSSTCTYYLIQTVLDSHRIRCDQQHGHDVKRRELLRQYRAGKLDLDKLTLPVLESEEERAERLKALEEALKAEEEGKEL